MKGLFGKLLPHLIAVVVFLLVALIYCKPALEGMVVNQSDVTQWKGSIHQSQEYAKTHGQYPLWTNALFSGMPANQIGMPGNNNLPWKVHAFLTLGLPSPMQHFFLACICFYFLCCVVRINPYVGIFGGLAYAYATYNPVILSVGHETKMWSISYMAALLGAILLIYERRKYWIGAALTGIFTSVLIAVNHPQIDYYLFLIAIVMTIAYAIRWVKAGELAHLGKALGITAVAGVIGLLVNSVTLFSTLEYQKATIRGGTGELTEKKAGDAKTGLTKDYAFDYSLFPSEPIVMMLPRAFGGSSDKPEVEQEESKAIQAAASVPEQIRNQLPLSYYWGGLVGPGTVGTSGPPYVGAIVCFLAIIGFFILDGRYKWWILGACLLAIMMSWGKYFMGFNTFLYNYLPLYNKFRAPSMILVIPQLLLPLMAVLTVQKVLSEPEKQDFIPYFKKGLIAVGAVIVLLFIAYFAYDFRSYNDKELLKQVAENPQIASVMRDWVDALSEDRKGLMMGDIWRAIGFCVVGAGILFLAIRKIINPLVAGGVLALVVLADLMPIANNYLSSENYQEPTQNDAVFATNAVDNEILADKSFFRVLNLYNPFNENLTAYHFNAIGGYHPAKLRIYQDLIENELSKEVQLVGNTLQTNPAGLDSVSLPALNMLNAKYIIAKNPGNGETSFKQQNGGALGNVWFVKGLRVVQDAKEEMAALSNLNPRDTAVIQQGYRAKLTGSGAWSGEGNIKLDTNDNDIIHYTYTSSEEQFAVFSEVFYEAGWKAFIDEKELPIVKVNYVLRGLQLPAGQNKKITFKYEPEDYFRGRRMTSIFSIALLVLIAGAIFFEWRANRKTVAPSKS